MKLPEASVTTTSETVPTVTEQGGVATSGVATLDQELANVMSGLGSFWGKVSKAVSYSYLFVYLIAIMKEEEFQWSKLNEW